MRVSFSGRTRPCQGRGGSSILPTRTKIGSAQRPYFCSVPVWVRTENSIEYKLQSTVASIKLEEERLFSRRTQGKQCTRVVRNKRLKIVK